jgi:superfamily I DNA/RNA helicase/RecB family exonuclease
MAVESPIPVVAKRDFVLTPEQRQAVEWGEGPLMVLAGAGTGKTTVVVERVRHLLATQPDLAPENILVLTYNVRAAAELMDRLEQLLGLAVASRLWVHNFHSLGHRILSDHRAELGLDVNADVLDGVGQRLLLRELRSRFTDFLYHAVARDRNAAGRFADVISRAKDELVTPEEYLAYAQAKREAFELRYGAGEFERAVEELRRRDALGTAWQVKLVRRDLVNGGPEAARRTADREARREVGGTGEAVYWKQLTDEQQRLVRGLTPTYLRDAEAFDVLRLLEEGEAYSAYQGALRERGQLDFGEQQLRAIQLLTDRPNILRRYQDQFRHVLVDEFQDANMAQILLLELVGRGPDKADNVVVVGDDDQSIYRFRGASYAAFERFRERFERPPSWAPDRSPVSVASQPLLDNRRSSGDILSAASRLIAHNQKRLKSDALRPVKPPGEPVRLVYAADEQDEADVVVDWVRRVRDQLPAPARWSDIAILYRKHRHRELIVERLRKQDIPYVIVGTAGLFNVAEVRDVEAALRVAAQPEDSSAFVRLLSAGPWRLDAAEILRVTSAANWDGRPIYQAALDILREGKISVADMPVRAASPPVAAPTLWTEADFDETEPETVRQRKSREQRAQWRREELDVRLRLKLQRLLDLLNQLVPRGQRDGPFAVLEEFLVRTNLLHDLIALETPEAQRAVLALARFMRFVAGWQKAHPRDSLAQFIGYLDVYEDVGGDLDSDQPARLDIDGVQLMTVYQAKGLEYEAVAVPRLVEGQFPDTRDEAHLIPVELLKQAPPQDFAIDEERRLLFVAMTRARSHLLLTAPQDAGARSGPSRFVGEISRAIDGPAPISSDDFEPAVPDDLDIERRASGPQAGIESVPQSAAESALENTEQLLKLMPVPLAHERRYALRRRAVELIGMLEALTPDDHDGRAALAAELVTVAEEAAGAADEARRGGRDPVTLEVVARHAPAGRTLLELAPLPSTLSHSQLHTYSECPLQYAFQRVYRIPVVETPGYFEFGHVIHRAFEVYARQRRDAAAAGQSLPGYKALRQAFEDAWQPRNFADAQAAQHYASRAEPALQRFYEREISRLAEAVDFEAGFTLELEGESGEQPVRLYGVIDRIDRHADGSIEITDYKTGRPRKQADVDADEQLSAYALAMAMGAVPDPATRQALPPASRLTLYFTETDQALSTTRTPEQLDDFRQTVLAKARRIRSGDFTATPDQWRCGRCDYRLMCPSRFGSAAA